MKDVAPTVLASPAEHPPTEKALALSNLTKSYQDPKHPAVADFNLSVNKGEILALLGPSGCGKTTLLRLIAGFEVPDTGRIEVAGTQVAGPAYGCNPSVAK